MFVRFKALVMVPSALAYAERHDNIGAIHKTLQEKRDTADVTEVLKERQRIVNEAIRTAASGDDHAEGLSDRKLALFDLLFKGSIGRGRQRVRLRVAATRQRARPGGVTGRQRSCHSIVMWGQTSFEAKLRASVGHDCPPAASNPHQEDAEVRRIPIGVLATSALTLWLATTAPAQTPAPIQPDLARLASGQGAQVFNRSLTAEKEGERAVARLDARAGDGGALLDGVQLGDGVIDVDLRGKDVAQRSFLGIAFHVVDWTRYEAVYFRPFNFRAATPEQRLHSVQYISHPINTWQNLRAERTGQFEKAVEPPPDPNGWFHARIVLAKSKVEVYVNNAATPSLVVDDLGQQKSGGVALWAGNGSDGTFASLKITPTAPMSTRPPDTRGRRPTWLTSGNSASWSSRWSPRAADSRPFDSTSPR
ncbi:MAG TPA: hypothetical protein VGK32_15440 [Vicinamibacterales bacterium]